MTHKVSKWKKYLLFVALFFFAAAVLAQRIIFSEKVDGQGKAVNESNSFVITKKGGNLDFFVNLKDPHNHSSVKYDIFRIDSLGREKFDNTVKQTIQPNWMTFWKQISFKHPGKYRVYVYDDYDKFICASQLTVATRQ